MHRLSIIIVNYRVPRLLGQCLDAVYAASKGLDIEVWVVDNASGDGSIAYLRERHPWVNYIENTENLGFSRANNIGIARSDSEYVLLLNPDTIIAEDTLRLSLEHMDAEPRCGAIGVRMYSIQGRYLRESKRGFPTTWASFCKLAGLARLFPTSRLFASYYVGHLDSNNVHSVEVLSGAFMMLRRSALEQIGGLDERFFMYGEDIDLSYRIVQAGLECHYLPLPIIHYKGESSVLDSSQYIRSFYGAMQLFYEKYHQRHTYSLGRYVIRIAIACVSTVARLKAICRRKRTLERPEPIPVSLPLTEPMPRGAHLLVNSGQVEYRVIIDQIVRNGDMGYTYHFREPDGHIVSPRR